jgi:DNA-binding beta-propeller fold protein YncE
MSSYDRFEYLEIGDRQPVTAQPPEPILDASSVLVKDDERLPGTKLVVDQIIGRRGTAAGEFNCPAGVDVDDKGNLYVADSYNHRLQRITPDGKVTVIGGKGTVAGCFLNPQDIVVDHQSCIYVLEQGNNRIQKIDSEGCLQLLIGRHGDRPGQFNSPMGLSIDRSGCIFIADTGNNRLQKLSALGFPVFVTNPRTSPRLFSPQGVDLTHDGHCYVADTFAHCIVEFDANGHEIRRFGRQGSAHGEFDEPQDLAVDKDGRLFVIEMANNRLQVFGDEHGCLACFESSPAVGRLSSPTGIAVGPSGEVYISDTMNHRILRAVWK